MSCLCKIGAQFVLNVRQAQKSIWTHPMDLLGDLGHVESYFSLFGESVSVVQDKCMVCAKRTIGLEIDLDTPNGTHR